MTRIRETLDPKAAMAAHYHDRYATFLALADSMQGFWSAQHARRA